MVKTNEWVGPLGQITGLKNIPTCGSKSGIVTSTTRIKNLGTMRQNKNGSKPRGSEFFTNTRCAELNNKGWVCYALRDEMRIKSAKHLRKNAKTSAILPEP